MTDWNYIVVGGGSAGALVATRLTESPDCRVLLLEAGPDYRAADTPREFKDRTKGLGLALEAPKNHLNPEFYWHGTTATRAAGQEAFQYRRGRGLGGSSTINGLYAIRGVPDDFAAWEAAGAEGWGPEQMLAAYRRIEDEHDFPDAPHHGSGGPTPVYREPESGWGGVDKALRDAALEAGHPWAADHNDPASSGVSPLAMNIRHGDRVSTNHAYIEPARGRDNLTILGETLVDRVLFEGATAVGVVDATGREYRVAPGGEVILSAGSTASPAILMRSGIGPAEDLAELGIGQLADLPVGRGAQDHAVAFVELPVDPAAQTCVGNRPTNIAVRYSSGMPGGRANDMMILATNHNYWFGKETAGLAVSLEQPLSRGRLRLRSADPTDEPHVDLDFLSDPRDLARIREGLRRARALMDHDAFRRIATGEPTWPQDDAEILATVKDTMHLTSTARMGRPGDPDTVVDPRCRVVGVDGLRVVDASIMPAVVSANTYLTVLALAEVFFDQNPELPTGSPDPARAARDRVAELIGQAGHLVNGRLVPGGAEATVTAPWDHSLSVGYRQATLEEVREAAVGAREAFRTRRREGGDARAWLLEIADRLEAAQEDLATLISFENGKLPPAARGEAAGAVASLRYWAGLSPSEEVLESGPTHETRLVRSPLGVVAAITPFNMPLLMMVNKIGAALMAGNTIVCKPSPHTPLTSLHVARLIVDAVPPGVVNVVCGGEDAGPALTSANEVDMVTFTGSIGVGKAIMASAAQTLKRVQLELGGNDPAIICADADLDAVVPQVFQAAFGSAGQACVAVKRVYAQDSVAEEVADRLAALAAQSRPGTPFTPGVTMPALTTRGQFDLMRRLLEDSRSRGAEVLFEGHSTVEGGFFAQPTIVTGLGDGAPLVEEEQFSPILPVLSFTHVDEAVEAVNAGRFGLGATVWTRDPEVARRVTEQLESGMVWINGLGRPNPSIPFGGAKESGVGREGGQLGLDAFTELKSVTVNVEEPAL